MEKYSILADINEIKVFVQTQTEIWNRLIKLISQYYAGNLVFKQTAISTYHVS